jgi:phosphatidylserine synthase
MTELDLLNLARSTTEHEVAWFAQMLSINFAMVVAIYYFLNAAKLTLKLFSFFAYSVGMIVLLCEMLVEANVKLETIEALRALPPAQLSRLGVRYLAVSNSWLASVTSITFNLSIWLLWVGVLYLLFFSGRHWNARDKQTNI